jgi:hypothetical protein
MPIIKSPPRDLLRLPYEAGLQSVTSAATHGAALTSAWGGTFIIANIGDVYIELDIYFIAHSGAVDVNLHFLVDGTCRMEEGVKLGSTNGRGINRRTTVTGLAAGSHTLAIQASTASGTGYIQAAAPPQRGLVTVREVG